MTKESKAITDFMDEIEGQGADRLLAFMVLIIVASGEHGLEAMKVLRQVVGEDVIFKTLRRQPKLTAEAVVLQHTTNGPDYQGLLQMVSAEWLEQSKSARGVH